MHVYKVSKQLNLFDYKQTDWRAIKELIEKLRRFDTTEPSNMSFVLFGLGIDQKESCNAGTKQKLNKNIPTVVNYHRNILNNKTYALLDSTP